MEPIVETTETIPQVIHVSTVTLSPMTILLQIFNILLIGILVYVFVLLIKALRRYLKSSEVRQEKAILRRSLGEVLKDCRIQNHMTQEFVAEHLGVSRQAVSKWENGTSDPSTSNLLSLAKLYGISPEELLKQVQL